jgi:aspartate/glutamate racemase
MKTVAAIYTTNTLIEPTKAMFSELMPEHRLINILDDSMIRDVISADGVTSAVRRRLFAYCRACEDMGADVILETCSSVGDLVDEIQPFVNLKILRIDEPMARRAVETGSSIAVLATLPTTLQPTIGLVRSVARKMGKTVTIVDGLAEGAFQALSEGKPELHDEILMRTAVAVAEKAEVILLAQGSMARMQEAIAKATGKPVFSSLRLGLESVKTFLENPNRISE